MNITSWEPAKLLKPSIDGTFALIVLNQPLEDEDLFEVVWSRAVLRVAADGGANRISEISNKIPKDRLNYKTLNAICGDLDSVHDIVLSQAKSQGAVIFEDDDQYATDFTKSYKYARRECSSPCDIVVLGGLGGRVDQAIATLNHLYIFQAEAEPKSGSVFLVSTEAITFVLGKGKHRIRVIDNDHEESSEAASTKVLGRNIGIIPKAPCEITTTGLMWDVREWRTEWGGQISTSNYVREEWVTIDTTGDLLFTIDFKLSPNATDAL